MNDLQEIADWAVDLFEETSDEGAERLWAHVFIQAKQAQALESHENAGVLPDIANSLQFLVLTDRRKEP